MTNANEQPRKRFLALDTATATLGVAVTEGGRVLHEINASGERNHSVHLLPIIGEALQASGGSEMLDGISVGVGPGSYTGTRIAITAAKSLAWGWKLPVVGVSTLQALAWGGWNAGAGSPDEAAAGQERSSDGFGPDWIVPLLDARRGQAYTALFAVDGGSAPQRLAPDRIRLMADWVQSLAERLDTAKAIGECPRRLWFVGETAVHGSGELLGPLEGASELRVLPYELEGRWVGFLGEARHASGDIDDVHGLIPNYTQLAEAEANLLKAGKGGMKSR
ncbi:tRNA threonylcarbamoyladenosine biosynthesis protein TsaB [Paenibacillus sophorae]|uniref:tRNA (Adenosine(37)-N6)-threonylcarbamoyltransferase complex dimerization subunit type 1 TsaB n=1 Tax=Paenibacillus sophorae TaxID=1333845 RepID=A0A1H8VKN7_9BACL|nr:tRNA (adenosine(37)-N6)-threonylcarbamoyltransferase complex dimerization subunit type 1 TsaB [Paenibacillus sophorae]QWU17193.1 tRNA (adenosine(37)-N6)-threonylcarbamoyltransferase complex dimerization subunit type 1 TsaB [Paenibacillus sophorae]SEP16012.1 tRNA threonylcarbamoyladenosine biosynthesis protein TsaB [Paenibacillus sophorae]